MSWFKKEVKPAFLSCSVCGVHFDPDKRWEGKPWDRLCYEHRKEWVERYEREQAVVGWARSNWEKLEPQMKEDQSKQQSAVNQHNISNMAEMQARAAQGNYGPFAGCLFEGAAGYSYRVYPEYESAPLFIEVIR